MADLAVLIPAAGASSRMGGRDKLMLEVEGESLLRRAAAMAVRTGEQVIVTLPNTGPMLPARRAALMGLGIRPVEIADYHDGMSASFRAGVRAAGPVEGLVILLPDMPAITDADLALLIRRFRADPHRPVRAVGSFGTPGHPVILPHRLFQEVAVLTGDAGARLVLQGEEVTLVPLADDRAVTDIDTPEDWNDWLASRTG